METEFYRLFAKFAKDYLSNDHHTEWYDYEQMALDLFLTNLELKAKVKMLEHQLVTFSDNLAKPKKNETSVP